MTPLELCQPGDQGFRDSETCQLLGSCQQPDRQVCCDLLNRLAHRISMDRMVKTSQTYGPATALGTGGPFRTFELRAAGAHPTLVGLQVCNVARDALCSGPGVTAKDSAPVEYTNIAHQRRTPVSVVFACRPVVAHACRTPRRRVLRLHPHWVRRRSCDRRRRTSGRWL